MPKMTWALAALALGTGAASATELATLEQVDGQALYWGLDGTPTYGQTLTLEEPASLESIELQVDDDGLAIAFDVSVRAWNGSGPAGPALFEASAATPGLDGMQALTLPLGGVSLSPGTYVVLLEATSEGAAAFASAEDSYEGGAWVYSSDSWFASPTTDLGFRLVY